MINMVIMVHSNFSEKMLSLKFAKIAHLKIISIPVQQSDRPFSVYSQDLMQSLQLNQIDEKKLDFFIIESNYGKHGDKEINEPLLDFVLMNFPQTKIFTFANTSESLAKALMHHPRLKVLKNSAELETELTTLFPSLSKENVFKRVYSLQRLEAKIQKAIQQVPPEKEGLEIGFESRNSSLLPQFALRANPPSDLQREPPPRISEGPAICGPG